MTKKSESPTIQTLSPEEIKARYKQAYSLFKESKYESADTLLDEILQHRPNHEKAKILKNAIRYILSKEPDIDDAEPEAREEKELDEETSTTGLPLNDIATRFNNALALFNERRYEESEQIVLAILKDKPSHKKTKKLKKAIKDIMGAKTTEDDEDNLELIPDSQQPISKESGAAAEDSNQSPSKYVDFASILGALGSDVLEDWDMCSDDGEAIG